MTEKPRQSHDAATTPVGLTTICPQCGVVLDSVTTTCGACGAVVTGAGAGERTERVRAKLQDAIGEAFVLGDLLGRGGMGIVFRAREKALDRDVALKVLAFDPLLNPDAYARFEREAKLAAKLDHPNIVPIFSVGQRNAVAFYTMRMVKGGSVEQMITPGWGLDLAQAVSILRDVAAALDYAHANGVVHRDIKPANILIGDSGHALVADFGIARAFGGDPSGTTATGTGVVGSPAYMSPEQWRGEKVDGKADQYALGILAFELLTGARPFADTSMQELLRMHLAEDPPDVVSLRQDLPSRVAEAIRHAMAKDPADRFVSSAAFVDALAGEVQSLGAVARAVQTGAGVQTVRTGAGVGPATPMPPKRTGRPAPTRAELATTVRAGGGRSAWPVVTTAMLVLAAGLGAMLAQKKGLLGGAKDAAPAALAASLVVDSAAAAERAAQQAETARLQKELEDTRKVALDAERKVERMSAAKSVPVVPHAHLFVVARGGTPAVFVDGQKMANSSPSVIEIAPGRHMVMVKGGQEFVPGESSVEVAANDTQQVVFTSRAVANRNARAQSTAAAVGGNAVTGGGGRRGVFQGPTPQAIIDRLGFDPQKVNHDTLTPQQRQRLNRVMKQMDSVRQSRKLTQQP